MNEEEGDCSISFLSALLASLDSALLAAISKMPLGPHHSPWEPAGGGGGSIPVVSEPNLDH